MFLPCQTFNMELFAKLVNDFKLLTIFAKSSILDVWLNRECPSEKTLCSDGYCEQFDLNLN